MIFFFFFFNYWNDYLGALFFVLNSLQCFKIPQFMDSNYWMCATGNPLLLFHIPTNYLFYL